MRAIYLQYTLAIRVTGKYVCRGCYYLVVCTYILLEFIHSYTHSSRVYTLLGELSISEPLPWTIQENSPPASSIILQVATPRPLQLLHR